MSNFEGPKPVALVVDDEPDICELLAITLERMNVETDTCGDVRSAKQLLGQRDYQVCLTDMRLPDEDGLDLVQWMQQQGLKTPVAVITAHGNVETAVRALKFGAFDFISKPRFRIWKGHTISELFFVLIRIQHSRLSYC